MSEEVGGDEDLGALLQELVNRVSHHGRGEVLSLMTDASVTLHQVMAMTVLAHRGACALSELGDALNMSQSAMSQMVDRLVQLRYVAREEDPVDRRKKRLTLTLRARRFLDQLREARSAEYREGVERLPPTLRAELADLLRRVLRDLHL